VEWRWPKSATMDFSWSFSRISGSCCFMETNNFGFVSAELHPHLFTPLIDVAFITS